MTPFARAVGNLADVAIPGANDWTDQGDVLTPGAGWDAVFDGMINPCAVVKLNGTFHLYYLGGDGTGAEGTEHRQLGVATASDGLTFSKYVSNPILSHEVPAPCTECGVFSAAAFVDDDGTVVLYYGGMEGQGSVDGDIVLATSTNGLDFTDQGDVIEDGGPPAGVIGDDEIFPLAAWQFHGSYYLYYTAKGGDVDNWSAVLATGTARDTFTTFELVSGIDGGKFKGDGGWVRKNLDDFVVFGLPAFGSPTRDLDIYIGTLDTPNTVVKDSTYLGLDMIHSTTFLDRDGSTWYQYLARNDGSAIWARTAPMVLA